MKNIKTYTEYSIINENHYVTMNMDLEEKAKFYLDKDVEFEGFRKFDQGTVSVFKDASTTYFVSDSKKALKALSSEKINCFE